MNELQQAAEDLEAAAELLETETVGWCQEALGEVDNVDPRHLSACAVGAISVVIYGKDVFARSIRNGTSSLMYAASSPLGMRLVTARENVNYYLGKVDQLEIENWNDVTGRTREEVVDLLKNVAKDLRNQL